MTVPPIVLPRLMTPKVMRLTLGWASLTIHFMGVGIALISSVSRVMETFQTYPLALGYALYLFFVAPFALAQVTSTFLRSMLARESVAATVGFIASILLEIAWLVILVRDLNDVWDP